MKLTKIFFLIFFIHSSSLLAETNLEFIKWKKEFKIDTDSEIDVNDLGAKLSSLDINKETSIKEEKEEETK